MLPQIDKSRLRNFTLHVILASRKSVIEKKPEEKKPEKPEMPEFLIKRTFPTARSIPVQPIVPVTPLPAIPKAEEKKEEQLFELGKITKFALDKNIDFIECSGPNTPLKVKKEDYTFSTDVMLREDEITDIISRFSAESKTPVTPIFRADAKGFSMTAIISPVSGSRFIISRIKV